MFRFSLLLCLSLLLYGSSASPFKSWGKKAETAHQETSLSDEYNEKMSLGLEDVKPLKDLDLTNVDNDLSMLLWKAVKQFHQQIYDKPEGDKDKLYHPSEEKLTVGNKLSNAYVQPQHYKQGRLYQEPEKDMDELYHIRIDHAKPEKTDAELIQDDEPVKNGPKEEAEEAEPSEKFMYLKPEEDQDHLHHGHVPLGSILKAQVIQAFDKVQRIYTEPEDDLDKLYHK